MKGNSEASDKCRYAFGKFLKVVSTTGQSVPVRDEGRSGSRYRSGANDCLERLVLKLEKTTEASITIDKVQDCSCI